MNGSHFTMSDARANAVLAQMQARYPDCNEDDVFSVLDGDWPEGAEHQKWLDTATVAEIVDWVDGIYVNMIEPQK